jgi:hypothetical protein
MLKRCALVCSLCVSVLLTSHISGRATAAGVASDPTNLPLLQFSDIAYMGGFRLPAGSANGDDFSYGGTPMTFNPIADSLFVGTLSGTVAEVNIPTPVNGANITDLPFATYLQPFSDPTEGNRGTIGYGAELDGLLVSGGRLYGTGYIFYDADNAQRVSHYSHSLTLSEPSFGGFYTVGNATKTGFVSGYMATVPPEWQTLLGGPAITGQCCIPIVSRTSWGPAAFAWNPADLGAVTPSPATPLLYYTEDHATLGPWSGSDATYGATTQMGGVAIIAGTRTALFVGRNGVGPYCYGDGTGDLALAGTTGYCYDPASSDKSQHAYPYVYQMWAYDLNDFAAVKAGTKQPWEVVPYGVWPITLPTTEPRAMVGGVGYDAARQILYFSQLRADKDGYASRSLIQALKITPPVAAATTTAVPAQLTAPAPGSTLAASTAQFQWNAGTGVSQYRLSIGTTAGGTQLYSQDQGTNLSATVTSLPIDGSTLYVRLASQIGGNWQNNDYTYTSTTVTATTTTTAASAQMISPAPGSTLTSSTVQFQWSGSTDASLSVGTTTGGGNLYSADQGTNLSVTVSGLPTDGSTVHVRLWGLTNGAWHRNDYTYTAATAATTSTSTTAASTTTSVPAPAELTTPTPGSNFASSTVQFQWNTGTGVTKYWLSIGAAAGGEEIYSVDQGTNLSATVTGLPTNGSPMYVRLWSMINGTWKKNDYVYTAATTGGTTAGAPAQLVTPAPGSTFPGSTVQFQWTSGSGVTKYWLSMGAAPGGEEIYSQDYGTNLNATVTDLPVSGRPIYVGLWSLIGGKWYRNDYTYVSP